MIIEMSSEHAVRHPARMRHREIKWSRGLRVTVALCCAVASWGALFGAGYLIAQIF